MSTYNSNVCSTCRRPATFRPRIKVDSSELYLKLRLEFGPSVFQPQEVEEMLLSSERDLEDYESEIVRLRTQIIYIRAQQERLKDHQANLRSLLSPIRKLPNETLKRIFEYLCEHNLLQEFPWNASCPDKPPTAISLPAITYIPTLVIGSVCTRWRSLTLSSPGLWSKFDVEIASGDIESPPPSKGFMSTLELFLERSGESPLSLSLDVRRKSNDHAGHLALTALEQHSRRWKTFQYDGSKGLATSAPTLSTMQFPLLERLDLLLGSKFLQRDLDCFERAPKLDALGVRRFVTSKLPYQQVTYLSTAMGNLAVLDDLMMHCPDLTALELKEVYRSRYTSSESVSPCTPPWTSNHIRSLTLSVLKGCLDQCMLDFILSSLTLPSLCELHIYSPYLREPRLWPKDSFSAFLTRSSCSIVTLTLERLVLSDVDLIAALRLLPSLVDLTVRDNVKGPLESPISSHFISSLHCSGQRERTRLSTPLLPRLRSLSLRFKGTEFDDAAFIAMVSLRWLPDEQYASMIGIDCLRSVVMRFHARKVDEDVYKPLYDLDRMGMRVVVTGK